MNKYTVILMYPDYMADPPGQEMFWAWVAAPSPQHAIKAAQRKACRQNDMRLAQREDFFVIACCDGYLVNHK